MLFPDRLPREHVQRAPVRAGRPVDRQECDRRRGMTAPRSNFHTPALRQKRKHSSGRVGRSTPGKSGRVSLQSRARPATGIGNRAWAVRPVFPPVLASGAGEGRRYAGDVARSVCSRSITRGIASVAATRIAGAVEPLSVDWSSGGSLAG